ncbi:MAG: beta-N-acetylhexosaminidase [Neisseriaceae bacterium]
MNRSESLGPIVADIAGLHLTEVERLRLKHPAVGGVILFTRNYQSQMQLRQLVAEIKAIKSPELLIAVDQEGGRIQRFLDGGFTPLPAMRQLGDLYDQQGASIALSGAWQVGWVLGTELRAVGVDFSFTPVLDLDWGTSQVIGGRSFHSAPKVVVKLARAFIRGLNQAGVKACGKHFPGHGKVIADSHHALPEDTRSWEEIKDSDLWVFEQLIQKELVPSVMTAHILYSQVDPCWPAGYSAVWLQSILRLKLAFKGIIFSDSLTMKAAEGVGGIVQRVRMAKEAGGDSYLICNEPQSLDEVLDCAAELGIITELKGWESMRSTKSSEESQILMNTYAFKKAQATVRAMGFEYERTSQATSIGE